MRCLLAVGLAFLCTACAGVPPPATASGKPEVTITDASPDKVKPALVNQMINAGFRITKDTPYELSFDKPVQNIAVAVLLGSKYDAQPNERVSYNVAQTGSSTRVVADLAIITNPGSAFERRTEINTGVDSHDVQVLLDAVRGDLDPTSPIATARRNKIVLGLDLTDAPRARVAGLQGPDKGLYVLGVEQGGLGERAGIGKGDVIIEFGGRPTNTLADIWSAQAATKPGSTVELAIWRQGTEGQVSVTFPVPTVTVAADKKKSAKATVSR